MSPYLHNLAKVTIQAYRVARNSTVHYQNSNKYQQDDRRIRGRFGNKPDTLGLVAQHVGEDRLGHHFLEVYRNDKSSLK